MPLAQTQMCPPFGCAQAVVKTIDMSDEMEKQVHDIASTALNELTDTKDIAAYIKKELDKMYRYLRAPRFNDCCTNSEFIAGRPSNPAFCDARLIHCLCARCLAAPRGMSA